MGEPPSFTMKQFWRVSECVLLLAFQHVSAKPSPQPVMNDITEGAERLTNTVKDVFEDTSEFVHHELDELVEHSALAGNILPVLQKLLITPEKAKLMMTKTAEVIDWQDVILIVFLGWFTMPLVKFPVQKSATTKEKPLVRMKRFQETLVYKTAETLSQIARLALLVYGADIIKIFLTCMGFSFPHLEELPQAFAKIIYTVWFVQRLLHVKSYWLVSLMGGEANGRVQLVDRLLDGVLVVVAAFFLFDLLSVKLGFTGKSVFAIGSVGTLVVSMAAQGLATELLNGLLLATSDRIYEGDSVEFGNGISGTVVKLGWIETIVRGSDEVMLSLPNSHLASQRVSNLSRILKSQVKQRLRFQYQDVAVLPLVVKDIKREIIASCPDVITDGSRPFRVHFAEYGDDHVEVVVDARFSIKPIGDAYWDNRQRVLMAIHKAVKKHQLEFAIATNG